MVNKVIVLSEVLGGASHRCRQGG